jgi:hypothetical protein
LTLQACCNENNCWYVANGKTFCCAGHDCVGAATQVVNTYCVPDGVIAAVDPLFIVPVVK